MISHLVTAIRTLTIVPVPGNDCRDFSDSLKFFPLIGLVLSFATFGLVKVFSHIIFTTYDVTGIIITLFLVVITGGLHLDGIADVADGFGGGRDKKHILEIMKDPRHGSYGVIAIVFVLLLKVKAFTIVSVQGGEWFFFWGPFIGRIQQALACSVLPYARNESGKAAMFVRSGRKNQFFIFLILLIWTALLFKEHLITGVLATGTGILSSILFYSYARHKIGGITGDCLGAATEISEIVYIYTGIFILYVV